jgi:hypothetical protein
MRIDGAWRLCDDQVVRPTIRGRVHAQNGSWVDVVFLVDTAADRTVFSADVLGDLGLPPVPTADRLEGVGGRADSVVVATAIQLVRENGTEILFRGQFAARSAV